LYPDDDFLTPARAPFRTFARMIAGLRRVATRRAYALAFPLLCFLLACEKEEQPLKLPAVEASDLVTDRVNMGDDYKTQIFYDFETARAVGTSEVASWDVGFATAPGARHVIMNGGNEVWVFNTRLRNFANVTSLPAEYQPENLAYDHPSGNPDSTGVGAWMNADGTSKEHVYIVQTGVQSYYKLQIVSASATQWEIAVGPLSGIQPRILTLPRDTAQNFLYFDFETGATVTPDPRRDAWDVVFTRYRDLVMNYSNYVLTPYLVNGVLLNPAGGEVAVDTTSLFENINLASARAMTYSRQQDAIGGQGWKTYNFTTGRYEVNPLVTYVVHTRRDRYFKIRFLDFYSPTGAKGSPSFQFQWLR